MDKITEKIWLGNYASSVNIPNLKKEGIKKILGIIDVKAPKYKKEDNFIQKIVTIRDSPVDNIIRYLGDCLNFIDGNEKVLVHCMAGKSRSATIVIAYIMWTQKKNFQDAMNLVSQKRPSIFLNFGFRDQLKMFEKLLNENNYDLNKINFKNIKWKATSTSFNW